MNRKALLLFVLFLSMLVVFAIRLFYIQVIDDSYKLNAESNAIRKEYVYAARGSIYDRNNNLLVANVAAYDLLVVPNQTSTFDTNKLAELLSIDPARIRMRLEKARKYSSYKPSEVVTQINQQDYASLQEWIHYFKGFYIQKRSQRSYPYIGAPNVVGYISEVTEGFVQNNPNYVMGDLIGVTGIEKSYEDQLKGQKGVRYVLVDVHNRVKGPFRDGQYDTLAVPGSNLISCIDIDLQLLGEMLMKGKRGSIVAIEPSSGEILALISSPTYDPNLLVGRKRSMNYTQLYRDSLNKPLYDRALLAEYPPGSPFKLINALIGLQEKVIDINSTFTCHHGFHFGSLHVACHCGTGYPIALETSISKSCNNYYCSVFKRIIENQSNANLGMDAWRKHVMSFGMGDFLNNDLPTGRRGFVPSAAYFNKAFGYQHWKAVSTISLGIGQGELLLTPIQMANMAATIANRGHYYTPHIVRDVGGTVNENYIKPHKTTIDPAHFEPVIEGMHKVFEEGTGRASRIESIPMCGKTGTAENPHGQDHSIFIAFAPKENPTIAISIIVENGYWGSRWAAPIASLMMESYINDSISRPDLVKRMMEGNLDDQYAKQAEELAAKKLKLLAK
jgi:penicillin-binding protein 2